MRYTTLLLSLTVLLALGLTHVCVSAQSTDIPLASTEALFNSTANITCSPLSSSCLAGSGCECQNGGTCVPPDFTSCRCDTAPGFTGSYCETPICAGVAFPEGCGNGECTAPGVCTCQTGWNGTDCTRPICDPPCLNGVCKGPNSCDCYGSGYQHCSGEPEVCGCDENECTRAFKPCDVAVTCINFVGAYNCSACPAGSPGTPYLIYPDAPLNYTRVTGGCNETGGGASAATSTLGNTATSPSTPAFSTSVVTPSQASGTLVSTNSGVPTEGRLSTTATLAGATGAASTSHTASILLTLLAIAGVVLF